MIPYIENPKDSTKEATRTHTWIQQSRRKQNCYPEISGISIHQQWTMGKRNQENNPIYYWNDKIRYLGTNFLYPNPRLCLLVLERGEGKKRGRNTDSLAPVCAPTRDGSCSLGVWPDPDLNPHPFGVWDGAPTCWATQPGQPRKKFNQTGKRPVLGKLEDIEERNWGRYQ